MIIIHIQRPKLESESVLSVYLTCFRILVYNKENITLYIYIFLLVLDIGM